MPAVTSIPATVRRYIEAIREPVLDWIQVEVTSRCNAKCIYCPRTVFRDSWRDFDITADVFQKIIPALGKTKMVYLQGWGEPFLHKDFFTMVSAARKAGCMVGTTTNGTLADREILGRIIDSGIDLIAFSLAGTDDTNNRIRKGTHIEKVIGTIRTLDRIRKESGRSNPSINIAYLALRSRFQDLEKLPALIEGMGVSQVIVSTLDFIADPSLRSEAIDTSDVSELKDVRAFLDAVRSDAGSRGISLYYRLADPGQKTDVCTENITRALFISASGRVSPCVYLNMPVADNVFSDRKDQSGHPYSPLSFGCLPVESIGSIWRKKTYKAFRKSFQTHEYFQFCRSCPKSELSTR